MIINHTENKYETLKLNSSPSYILTKSQISPVVKLFDTLQNSTEIHDTIVVS